MLLCIITAGSLLQMSAQVALAATAAWSWATDVLLVDYPAGGPPSQGNQKIIRASDGNFIVVWQDDSSNVKIQKVSSVATDRTTDFELWTSGGVTLTAQGGNPELISDGSGGAFVVWSYSSWPAGNIYAQHVDSFGTPRWTAGGVQISETGGYEFEQKMISDGAGGMYVGWRWYDPSFNAYIFVTRINNAGTVDSAWNTGGGGTFKKVTIPMPPGATSVNLQDLVTDGSNNLFLTFNTDTYRPYVTKLDNTGSFITTGNWPVGGYGIEADTSSGNFINFRAFADGSNGIIAINQTYTVSWNNVSKGWRIDGDGNRLWGTSGITIDSAGGTTFGVSDGAGGAYATWENSNSGTDYVMRYNSAGAALWGSPTDISDPLDGRDQYIGHATADGQGNIIIALDDYGFTPIRTYLQKVDSNGNRLWPSGAPTYAGYPFGTTSGNDNYTGPLVSDGSGGVAYVWQGNDLSWNADLYMQYLEEAPLGPVPDAITNLTATPGNNLVTLDWTLPNDNGSTIVSFIIQFDQTGGGFTQTIGYSVNAACPATIPGTACSIPVSYPSVTNFTDYEFRLTTTNANGTSTPSNEVTAMPTPCSPLLDNDDSGGPTVSESCLNLRINAGTLSLENIPASVTFPRKFSTQLDQHSFSNDDSATGPVDVDTTADDIITVSDLRNSGGFDLLVNASVIGNGMGNEIPFSNLYVASAYPENDDLTPIDSNLVGTQVNGIEFADGSSSTAEITAPAHSAFARGTPTNATQLQALVNAYTVDGSSFDTNSDDTMDPVLLMQSTGARLARMSQALGFYMKIPGNQAPGTYSVIFTIDLIPTGGPPR